MISHGILTILPPDCTKFVRYLPLLRNLRADVESQRFLVNAKSRREMVVENQEMVMKKSLKSRGQIFGQVSGNPKITAKKAGLVPAR